MLEKWKRGGKKMIRRRAIRKAPALSVVVVLLLAFTQPDSTIAYGESNYWPTASVRYHISSTLPTELNIASSSVLTHEINTAATNWNVSSRSKLSNSSSSPSYLITSDMLRSEYYAVTGYSPQSIGAFTHVTMQFNRDLSRYTWNTTGDMTTYYSNGIWIRNADIRIIAAHEFGHWLGLNDNPPTMFPNNNGMNSVMSCAWNGCGVPSQSMASPTMDDKMAASLMYGMSSGFEVSEFLGLYPNPNAEGPGYLNSGSYSTCQGLPAYWTYTYASQGMSSNKPPLAGVNDRLMKYDGCAKTSGSPNYAYATIASAYYDSAGSCGVTCHLKVTSNMNLRWYQYNSQQCTISLDIEFWETLPSSGNSRFMRDYRPNNQPYRDTAGVSVHPADRSCSIYGTGQWFYDQINLSPFAGLHIKRILVAYDNSNDTTRKLQWRAYFDPIILGP